MKAVAIKAFADTDGTSWRCDAPGGLFAFGDTFRAARRHLAEVALEELNAAGKPVDAVQIFCVTRKTFRVNDGAIQ